MGKYYQLIPAKVLDRLPEIEQTMSSIPGYNSDNLKQIITLICFLTRKNEDNWAHIKIEYLRKYVPQADLYLKELLKQGVIESTNSYTIGLVSKKYRYSTSYQSKYVSSPINNAKLERRIEKANKEIKSHSSRKYPAQNNYIRNMTLDPTVYGFIEETYSADVNKYNYAIASATRIDNKDFYYSVDDTSHRYHSNVTNLLKTLRRYIRIEGTPLLNVDVKNCQPYLSTLIFTDPAKLAQFAIYKPFSELLMNLQVCLTEDVQRYISLVVLGKLYEYLLEEFQKHGLHVNSRDEVKKQVYITLFGKNSIESPSKKIFRILFPTVDDTFRLIKGNEKGDKFRSYKRFAILLQRIESHIVLDNILVKLYKEHPDIIAITIHDSIMASIDTNDVNTVYNVMEEEFTKYTGYKPTLKIERE